MHAAAFNASVRLDPEHAQGGQDTGKPDASGWPDRLDQLVRELGLGGAEGEHLEEDPRRWVP